MQSGAGWGCSHLKAWLREDFHSGSLTWLCQYQCLMDCWTEGSLLSSSPCFVASHRSAPGIATCVLQKKQARKYKRLSKVKLSLSITSSKKWHAISRGQSVAKNPPAMQEMQKANVWSLGQEDPLEEGMTTHSSIPARRIPWTEELGGLRSIGSRKVGHDWSNRAWTQSKTWHPISRHQCGTSGKEPAYQCRRWKTPGFNPWVKKIPWRTARQPTPVFLPGKSHRQRSLVCCSPVGCKESDTTEVT